jgi:hypothetical protein
MARTTAIGADLRSTAQQRFRLATEALTPCRHGGRHACSRPKPVIKRSKSFCGGFAHQKLLLRSLALSSLDRTCRNHRPGFSAMLTTMAFDHGRSRWLGISELITEPEGPSIHLQYSCAAPCGPTMLVTQDHSRLHPTSLAPQRALVRLRANAKRRVVGNSLLRQLVARWSGQDTGDGARPAGYRANPRSRGTSRDRALLPCEKALRAPVVRADALIPKRSRTLGQPRPHSPSNV